MIDYLLGENPQGILGVASRLRKLLRVIFLIITIVIFFILMLLYQATYKLIFHGNLSDWHAICFAFWTVLALKISFLIKPIRWLLGWILYIIFYSFVFLFMLTVVGIIIFKMLGVI